MSYEEAIIIPLDVFKKCNFSNTLTSEDMNATPKMTSKDILTNSSIPPDIKVKMYTQKKKLHKKRAPEPQIVTVKKEEIKTNSEDIILNEFPMSARPNVYMILKFIKENSGILSWNNDLELVIEGKTVPNSNIIQLLKFVNNLLTVTSDKDIPVGANEFLKALENTGIPKTYIKLPRRSQRISPWINI